MSKDCDIVRDLIPLYADDQASEESGDLITDHCRYCDECRKYLKFALDPVKSEVEDSDEQMKKMFEITKQLRIKSRRKYKIMAIVSVIVAVVLAFGCFNVVFRGITWFTVVDYAEAENYESMDEMYAKSYLPDHVSAEEVKQAAAEVKHFFSGNFGGCILLNLTYSEENSSAEKIVFYGDYMVLSYDGINEPFTVVGGDWHWDLTYNTAYLKWMVTGYGYA